MSFLIKPCGPEFKQPLPFSFLPLLSLPLLFSPVLFSPLMFCPLSLFSVLSLLFCPLLSSHCFPLSSPLHFLSFPLLILSFPLLLLSFLIFCPLLRPQSFHLLSSPVLYSPFLSYPLPLLVSPRSIYKYQHQICIPDSIYNDIYD